MPLTPQTEAAANLSWDHSSVTQATVPGGPQIPEDTAKLCNWPLPFEVRGLSISFVSPWEKGKENARILQQLFLRIFSHQAQFHWLSYWGTFISLSR